MRAAVRDCGSSQVETPEKIAISEQAPLGFLRVPVGLVKSDFPASELLIPKSIAKTNMGNTADSAALNREVNSERPD